MISTPYLPKILRDATNTVRYCCTRISESPKTAEKKNDKQITSLQGMVSESDKVWERRKLKVNACRLREK